jgi:hypothetical protein
VNRVLPLGSVFLENPKIKEFLPKDLIESEIGINYLGSTVLTFEKRVF